MIYGLVILFSMGLIVVFNYFFPLTSVGYTVLELCLWTVVSTVSVIIIDGIFATIVRRLLPKKYFSADRKGFCAGKKERKFYETIGIKKWKDKVLELGVFTSFRKNKILDPHSLEYVERYVVEANYGIICHLAGIIFGIGAVFCCPKQLWLTVGVPVVFVNTVLSALPIFILRYNLVKLHVLRRLNKKREEQKKNEK